MYSPLELLSPKKLGGTFRRVLMTSILSNLGDGVLIAAGPLLVQLLTKDPFLVSLALFMQTVPWVLFGLFAGVVNDSISRKHVMLITGSVRFLVLSAASVMLLTGSLNIWLLYLLLFIMGTGETFGDNAWSSVIPDIVPSEHLGTANSRLIGSNQVLNQLAGPALGGLLFAVASWLPYAFNAVLFGSALVLIVRTIIPNPHLEAREKQPAARGLAARSQQVFADLGAGLSWLWQHAAIRTLAIVIFTFNITWGAAWGVLVLYAHQILGLTDWEYGIFMALSAVGGVLGTVIYSAAEKLMSYTTLMRIGLSLETLLMLAFAVTSNRWFAAIFMLVFGFYAVIWGTLSMTIRGRAVPTEMRGRVGSVYMLGVMGGIAIGTGIGGALAGLFGITAPFWFAFAADAVILALLWRALPAIGRAGQHGPQQPLNDEVSP